MGGNVKLPAIFKFVPSKIFDLSFVKRLDFSRLLKSLVPKIKNDLLQANMNIAAERYINISFVASVYFFLITSLFFTVAFLLVDKLMFIPPFLIIACSLSLFMLLYSLHFPRAVAIDRMKRLERQLLTALRHVLIKVRSGVPLFQSFVSLTEGYEELSEEIKALVESVNAGVPLEVALEEAATQNPSSYFRGALIQISVAIKSGADLDNTLSSIINSLSEYTVITSKKYGRELNFWSVFYLIISIIFPAMGVSFFVMLSSFLGFVLNVSTLIIIAVVITILQLSFLLMINSRRPSLVVY